MELTLSYKIAPSEQVIAKILEKIYYNPFMNKWEKVAFMNPAYLVDTICYTKKTHQTGEWEVLENAPVVKNLDDINWAKEHDVQLIAKTIYQPNWRSSSLEMYGDNLRVDVMVSNHADRIRLSMYFEDDFAKDKTAAILDYAWEMYQVVEGDNMFIVHHDFNENYHYPINDIIEPPMGMGLFWAVIKKKSSYQKFVDKSALLSMPAYKVEELENDSVFIQYYEDPWEYDSPEAIEYQRQCSAHIIEHLHSDWDEWKAFQLS
jgi:hypothetical protein